MAAPIFYVWYAGTMTKAPIKNTGPANQIQVGDGSDTAPSCHFSLPEWWETKGREVIVRHVIVDFTSYATGVAATNHFDLQVKAIDLYEGTTKTSAAQSFDEASASSSASGTRRTMKFSFGDQGRGRAYQLIFTNIRGVKVIRAKAYGTVEPPRIA